MTGHRSVLSATPVFSTPCPVVLRPCLGTSRGSSTRSTTTTTTLDPSLATLLPYHRGELHGKRSAFTILFRLGVAVCVFLHPTRTHCMYILFCCCCSDDPFPCSPPRPYRSILCQSHKVMTGKCWGSTQMGSYFGGCISPDQGKFPHFLARDSRLCRFLESGLAASIRTCTHGMRQSSTSPGVVDM